jgi:hypothetical protein
MFSDHYVTGVSLRELRSLSSIQLGLFMIKIRPRERFELKISNNIISKYPPLY